jgi:hypothetical protein
MAKVLESLRWPQKRSVAAFRPLPRVDPKILELQAAKEILAEIFGVRISEVDEMILNRYDVRYEESISGERDQWPREFQLEG